MNKKMTIKNSMISIAALIYLFSVKNNAQSIDAIEVFKNTQNSIVKIYATIIDGIGIKQGSGVVIKDKIVATTYHNFDECDKLYIQHYQTKYEEVKIIYADPEKDILIIKIKNLNLKPVEYVDNKQTMVGEKVFAIGSPEGYENTITEGIISGIRDTNRVLQITAGITHGSSGGAVLNSQGKLIGISNAGYKTTNININFAIPIEYFVDSTKWCDEEDIKCNDSLFQKYSVYNILTHTFQLMYIYYENNNMGMVFKKLKTIFETDPTNEKAREIIYYMLKKFNLNRLGVKNVKLIQPYMPNGFKKIIEGLEIIENKRGYYNAINLFIDAVNEEPNNRNYNYFLGIAYAEQGYYENALKCMIDAAKNGDEEAQKWLIKNGYTR